ncbi:MAG: transketolase [Chloroherpetonaceae bacterium]|nr:transketolase [Chthonomonadaceae bacterium]MDW8207362.1 transketolase [Chloroherpetonaceae bacterium]
MGHTPQEWKDLATQLRADSIRSTSRAGSGHPTSSMSAADLMAVLLRDHLHYDFQDPRNVRNDRLIFSKGHAAPLLYAMFKAAGAITDEEMMTLREHGSRIEGHPVPAPNGLPYVDVATGSLGQGLPIGVGIALSAKYLDRLPLKVWVLLGDSEMAEGSVWEAIQIGGFYGLDNLIAIVDMNRLGQRGTTMLQWQGDVYAERIRAFGWQVLLIDGHDVEAIHAAYTEAERGNGKPVCIIAKTKKGAGVSFTEDVEGYHGKAIPAADVDRALAELGNPAGTLRVSVAGPRAGDPAPLPPASPFEPPVYEPGAKVATREAYGDALVALGRSRPDVVVLDGEVSNSTFSEKFKKVYPERFFEVYIAEQQLVSAAVGMQVVGKVPFASTFAAFFTRAYDQIRMAAISRANIRLCGSHAGVSIGEDGASQMALEDLAMMRAVHGSTVLYPSCATATVHLVAQMAECGGICYLRTTREKTPVIYGPEERFPVGGSKVLRRSDNDQAAVIAAGITLHEALKAHEILMEQGIAIRVIDLYSIKPIDAATLQTAARECGGKLVVVEDHWPEGGMGDAVLAVFADAGGAHPIVRHLAVRDMPGSGKPQQMLAAAGIDAASIVKAVRALVG